MPARSAYIMKLASISYMNIFSQIGWKPASTIVVFSPSLPSPRRNFSLRNFTFGSARRQQMISVG
jgi:hypothetical protein